jgi:hypothetical protein
MNDMDDTDMQTGEEENSRIPHPPPQPVLAFGQVIENDDTPFDDELDEDEDETFPDFSAPVMRPHEKKRRRKLRHRDEITTDNFEDEAGQFSSLPPRLGQTRRRMRNISDYEEPNNIKMSRGYYDDEDLEAEWMRDVTYNYAARQGEERVPLFDQGRKKKRRHRA